MGGQNGVSPEIKRTMIILDGGKTRESLVIIRDKSNHGADLKKANVFKWTAKCNHVVTAISVGRQAIFCRI